MHICVKNIAPMMPKINLWTLCFFVVRSLVGDTTYETKQFSCVRIKCNVLYFISCLLKIFSNF